MIKIYPRNIYIQKLKPHIGQNIIKVLTGQRRCGKSYMLLQIQELVKKKIPLSNVIYIDKEDMRFDQIQDYKDLYQYVDKSSKKGHKNIIMIDEIQEIESFEKAIRDFNKKDEYDVFITGSNANLLSGNLATLLAGRYIEINISSLSYNEFSFFHGFDHSFDTLKKYLQFGGMPYLVNLPAENKIIFEYLKNLYDSIVLKDVVARNNIRNVHFLNRLLVYLADNTGSLVTAKNISDYLKSQRISMSVNTVMNYIKALEDAFIIHRVNRYDIVGKKKFEVNDKYYFEDLGIRNAIIGFRQQDIGKILENLVFKHLKICGFEVFVGKNNNLEIDFVAKKKEETVYFQVAYHLHSQETINREFGNLLKIKDNHRKIVLSMDEFAQGNIEGVEHMHVLDFLQQFDIKI